MFAMRNVVVCHPNSCVTDGLSFYQVIAVVVDYVAI